MKWHAFHITSEYSSFKWNVRVRRVHKWDFTPRTLHTVTLTLDLDSHWVLSSSFNLGDRYSRISHEEAMDSLADHRLEDHLLNASHIWDAIHAISCCLRFKRCTNFHGFPIQKKIREKSTSLQKMKTKKIMKMKRTFLGGSFGVSTLRHWRGCGIGAGAAPCGSSRHHLRKM